MESTAARLERGAHLVALYLSPVLARLELTQGEAHVLAHLARAGDTPIGALHHEFGHKRSTLTSIVDRLEARNLVRREVNPRDRRSFIVALTSAGRKPARTVTRALDALEGALARSVSAAEQASVGHVIAELERIVASSQRGDRGRPG